MKNAYRMMMALMCMLALLLAGFAAAEGAGETPAPRAAPTPAPEALAELAFRIEGPDESMPMTVKYSDFRDGKYVLEGLAPGTYTVTEIGAETLAEGYTLDVRESVQQVTIEVEPEETGSGTLINIYDPAPAPTKDPAEETVRVPVRKVWADDGNRDGNRPDRVTVHLLANGRPVARTVLSEANGWSWWFTGMPRYAGEKEIVYTVAEDPVPMYTPVIQGFTITNVYTPETTSASVMKIWLDDNDAKGMRPKAIRCELSNGQSVELNAENNWSATVDGLPAYRNGQPAEYTWTEHEVIGYERLGADRIGNTTVFTNGLIERGGEAPEGKAKPARRRGDTFLVIEEYETALGMELTINHVGDCFD